MALIDNLIAHWKMEEDGTTTRADSHGSYHLPYYGGPGSIGRVAGKIGSYAAAFDESTNYYLRRSSLEEAFHPTIAYTVAFWLYRNTDFDQAAQCACFWEDNTTGDTLDIYMRYASGYEMRYFHTQSGGAAPAISIASSLQAWEFFVIRWNGSEISISKNNGTPSTALAASIMSWTDGGSAASLKVGSHSVLSVDFYIDSMSFWHRSLSDAEITQLYNSGNGLDYPFGMAVGSKAHMPLFTRG